LLGVLQHPFSRDSIHINSTSPTAYPTIDPGYLFHPFDLSVLHKIILHLDHVISKTAPLSDLLEGNGTNYQPGYAPLTEGNVDNWIKKDLQSEYHPIGTCAMMPKEKRGGRG
jgi:choline dehydrogenase